jgi:hypothetical protein
MLSTFSKDEVSELPPVLLGVWGGGILMQLLIKSPELVSVFIEANWTFKKVFF